jgi:uncharacterized membrane protein YdcZ (DUF606 family)
MATWKVFVVFLFGCVSLALMCATVVAGMSLGEGGYRWAWLGGLLGGTLLVGSLFALSLHGMDKSYGHGRAR